MDYFEPLKIKSTSPEVPHQTTPSNPLLTPSEVLKKLSPAPLVPVKESTKKEEGTVIAAAKFTDNKRRESHIKRRDMEEGAKSHS